MIYKTIVLRKPPDVGNLIMPDRDEIIRKAYEYLSHPDEYVRLLAQIAIHHYGDR